MSLRHSFCSLGVGFALFAGARAAGPATPINFKVATLIDSSNEGPDRERAYISMGARRIAFKQPQKSEMSAAPESLIIYLAKRGLTGQFTVINSPLAPSADIAAATQVFYDEAKASLPAGAENVEFKGADFQIYAVSDRTCVALDWTYTLFGRQTHRQVAFVNIDPEHQVCLTVLAEEESWEGTLGLARRFMNSWYWADDVKNSLGVR